MENNQGNKFQRLFNFDNIGTKIKNFTKWYCWVSIIIVWVACAVCFIAGCTDDDLAFLIVIAFVGAALLPFLTWISSWMMYAVGELVEKTSSIERNTHGANGEIKSETQIAIDNERLQKLESLRAKGLITEEEYQQALQKKG